jgi:DNA recombination protein RmuC
MLNIEIIIELLILIGLLVLIYLYFVKPKESSVDEDKLKLELEAKLVESFSKSLSTSKDDFLKLANEKFKAQSEAASTALVTNTDKVEKDVKELKDKMGELSKSLSTAVGDVKTSGTNLGEHVTNLSDNLQAWNLAMASNKVRGDLGEEALERILSDSGLKEGTNYFTQQHNTVDGQLVKPDIVVELANGGNLVIDSKFPYDDFRRAVEEGDPARQEEHYKKHANAVLKHVKDLSKKDYFSYLNSSPEYTVLYLNSVIYYYHALRLIPDFVEQARRLNIVVATPEILIPLLSGVMQQWKEHKVMADIGKVTNEVSNLHSRLKAFMGHMDDVSKELGKAGSKVNDAFKSFNSRVLPSIRRIEDLSAQNEILEDLKVDSSIENDLDEESERQ